MVGQKQALLEGGRLALPRPIWTGPQFSRTALTRITLRCDPFRNSPKKNSVFGGLHHENWNSRDLGSSSELYFIEDASHRRRSYPPATLSRRFGKHPSPPHCRSSFDMYANCVYTYA